MARTIPAGEALSTVYPASEDQRQLGGMEAKAGPRPVPTYPPPGRP